MKGMQQDISPNRFLVTANILKNHQDSYRIFMLFGIQSALVFQYQSQIPQQNPSKIAVFRNLETKPVI
jgi:hypothetical protein